MALPPRMSEIAPAVPLAWRRTEGSLGARIGSAGPPTIHRMPGKSSATEAGALMIIACQNRRHRHYEPKAKQSTGRRHLCRGLIAPPSARDNGCAIRGDQESRNVSAAARGWPLPADDGLGLALILV